RTHISARLFQLDAWAFLRRATLAGSPRNPLEDGAEERFEAVQMRLSPKMAARVDQRAGEPRIRLARVDDGECRRRGEKRIDDPFVLFGLTGTGRVDQTPAVRHGLRRTLEHGQLRGGECC